MCTFVVDWVPDADTPLRILAIRDELVSRPFELPAYGWPDFPRLFGGRDRQAGGTWCVSDVLMGTTAALLNRIEKRVGEPGAPSRGLLPLLAARYGASWVDHVDLTGVASFNLVLAQPDRLTMWAFDGAALSEQSLAPGIHMITVWGADPAGLDPRWDRWIERFTQHRLAHDVDLDLPREQLWAGWLQLVREAVPSDDPTAFIVRHEVPEIGDTFATVFGQLIAAKPGSLRVDHSLRPWDAAAEWVTEQRTQAQPACG